MTDAARRNKIGRAMLSEFGGHQRWFWLSFCDPQLPEGLRFLGACIVRAEGPANALAEAWRAGCNPGGEAQTIELPGTLPSCWPRYRLLSKAEIEHLEAITPPTPMENRG